jgi:nitrogen fixation protein NifX
MMPERRLRLITTGPEAVPMETAIRVAFATGDMKHVDQHFGAAEAFAIYQVDPRRASLGEAIQFGRLALDGNEDKLAAKLDALEGCVAVYCQAVGASAMNQLRSRGIQPVKVAPGAPIQTLVAVLQAELKAGPDTWVARAIAQQRPRDRARFDHMEEQGWVE